MQLVDYKYHMDCFFVCLADPFLESDNAGLKCAVCIALGVITKSTALPLPAGGEGDTAEEVTKLSLVNKLIGMIKTAKETNKVSVLLAYVCVFNSLSYWREVDSISVISFDGTLTFKLSKTIIRSSVGSIEKKSSLTWFQEMSEH